MKACCVHFDLDCVDTMESVLFSSLEATLEPYPDARLSSYRGGSCVFEYGGNSLP